MRRVRLVHWNREEAREKAVLLEEAGLKVRSRVPSGQSFFRELRESPPDAVLIDLARLPAQGRDLALGIREGASTRHIPILFLGGDPEKVGRIRSLLPDAGYCGWGDVLPTLEEVISNPPTDPVRPRSRMEGYSGTPLVRKLGIKPGSVAVLVGAPAGFEEVLGDLPEGARLCRDSVRGGDLVIWFVRRRDTLEHDVLRVASLAGGDGLWIAWPKKASGVTTDLSQSVVREVGLASGLVDYKIAAIDATWSGLRFTHRKRG